MLMNARQRGISLIEVLVTLIILLVGLLGLAGLVAHSNQSEMESYQRVQALQLMNDMVSRLNANRQVASCYSNSTTGVTLGTGATSIPTCGTGSSAQQTQATNDLTEWDTLLKGSAELSGTSRIGAMIGARGCITLDDATNNVYMVTVSWQGLAPTAAPLLSDGVTPFPCGNGQYSNEKLHRIVTAKVRIGKLS